MSDEVRNSPNWENRRKLAFQGWYYALLFPLIGFVDLELAKALAPYVYGLIGSVLTIGYFGGSSYEASKGVKG